MNRSTTIVKLMLSVCSLLGAISAMAGSLAVNGDFSVSSNLTMQSFAVGPSGDYHFAVYNPNDIGYGLAMFRNDYCEDGYLSSVVGWCGKAAINVFADQNATPAELGINITGGQVSINAFYANDGFNVGTNAVFSGDVTVEGKLNVNGGMDPPYLLLDAETRDGIATRVAREVSPEKQGGAVLFFDQTAKRLEVYVPAEGTYYDLAGKIVSVIAPPKAEVTIGTRYRFDAETGQVIAEQTVKRPRHSLRKGYVFDTTDGQFYRLSSGADSRAPARTPVQPSEAVSASQ